MGKGGKRWPQPLSREMTPNRLAPVPLFFEVNGMNFLKSIVAHWKTSTAGIAAGLLIVLNSYRSGMTWKQWAMAAAVTFMGLSAGDATTAKPEVKAP